jgi:hypothetical protein
MGAVIGETRARQGPRWGLTVIDRLSQVAASPQFAYGSILALEAKLLWGIWEHRDLPPSDTSGYFVYASNWADHRQPDLIWSPMYTSFYGSLQWLGLRPYDATILHRVLIVICVALLVLAVLRKLLTPGIAWALAVWFAVDSQNLDPTYEVHLFSAIPELAAVLVALTWSGLRMRATVFGILFATAVLQRNEVIVAVIVWGAIWLAYELRLRRHRLPAPSAGKLAAAVAVPVAIVVAIAAYAYLSDPRSSAEWKAALDAKHEGNICQVYAFGYQQRHDDFTGSPWTGCQALMQRDFGTQYPSFLTAYRANPGAMTEHVLWNARLIPYGLQLMFFNRISSDEDHDPDFAGVRGYSHAALVGSIAITALLLAGATVLWRRRRRWWVSWIKPRAWGWAALGSLAVSGAVVVAVERPRPEYLYALEAMILAMIGMSVMVLAEGWRWTDRLRGVLPVAAVALIVLVPSHFGPDYVTSSHFLPGRPIKTIVDRLEPYRDRLRGQETKLLASGPFGGEVCRYVGGSDPCTGELLGKLLAQPPRTSPEDWLDREGIDFIYVAEGDLAKPRARRLVGGVLRHGWHRVGPPAGSPRSWLLLGRD